MNKEKLKTFASKFLVFADAVKNGLIELLKWVAVLAVIGLVAANIPEIIDGFKNAGDAADDVVDAVGGEIKKVTVDCEELLEEMNLDLECQYNESCTMTRDELDEARQREKDYQEYCR